MSQATSQLTDLERGNDTGTGILPVIGLDLTEFTDDDSRCRWSPRPVLAFLTESVTAATPGRILSR